MNAEAHKQRLDSKTRQAEIIDAVLDLAREENPEAITTQTMAARIGLTQGALFRHFPNKESVWRAVFEWVAERIAGLITQASLEGDDPLTNLERIFLAHARFVSGYPAVPRILFHQLQSRNDSMAKQQARAILGQYRQRVAALIEVAKAQGRVSPDLDSAMAAGLFLGILQGLVMQSVLEGREDTLQERAAELFPFYLKAIGGKA
jgi:AcrR family transcriptional regulator